MNLPGEQTLTVTPKITANKALVERLSSFALLRPVQNQRSLPLILDVSDGLRPVAEWRGPIIVYSSIAPSEDDHRRAMRSGAAGHICESMGIAELRGVVMEALRGIYSLPAVEASLIASRLAVPPVRFLLTERDSLILHSLRAGMTVEQIAAGFGCSERQARRHLAALWRRLGARGRVDGLVAAARFGCFE